MAHRGGDALRIALAAQAIALALIAAGEGCASLDGLSGAPGGPDAASPDALEAAADVADGAIDVARGPRPEGGAVDAADAASTDDAGDDGSAADAGPCDVPGNLLAAYDPSFELPGCAAWSVNNTANATTSDVALCGSHSCRVCATGNSPAFGLYFTLAVLPGEEYLFTGWVEADADAGSDGVEALWSGDPSASGSGNPVQTTSTWQEVSVLIVVDDGGTDINNVFYADYNDPGTPSCFLVDDAALVRVKDAGP